MSLQVWLPLNGNLNNQGLSEVTVTNNGAAADSNGKIGSCYSFNTGKYLTVTRPIAITKEISYSCWVKISSWNNAKFDCIMTIDTGLEWKDCRATLCRNGDRTNLTWNIANGSSSSRVNSNTSLSLNTWYHIACTYDGTKLRIYVNGVEDNSVDTSLIPNYDSAKLYIGSSNGNICYLNGFLNDVRIYDHCLSAKEVKEISRGLICHYKLADPYIESTTNLYSGWSSNCYNAVTGNYYYGAGTDMYYDTLDDGTIKVRMGTDSVDAWPLVFFSNLTPPSSGEYRTISFDYFPSIIDMVQFYSYGTSGTINWIVNGVYGSDGYIPVNVNSWNHLSITIKNVGTSSDGFGFMKIGTAKHTSSTSNYWLFKNIQIESKDHSTGYTSAGTSRNPDTEYDVSGYKYNGTISESLTYVPDSPRYSGYYYFNSTSKRITLPAINMSGFSNSFSISWWGKAPSYSSLMYWGFSDGNRLNYYDGMYCNTGDGHNNPYYKPNTTTTISAPSVNTWHHFVMVGNGSSNKLYMDGELYGIAKTYVGITGSTIVINGWDSSTSYKTNGYISDFRIYSTALSASDIKELYNTSASIDKNGNMYAYEFKEE